MKAHISKTPSGVSIESTLPQTAENVEVAEFYKIYHGTNDATRTWHYACAVEDKSGQVYKDVALSPQWRPIFPGLDGRRQSEIYDAEGKSEFRIDKTVLPVYIHVKHRTQYLADEAEFNRDNESVEAIAITDTEEVHQAEGQATHESEQHEDASAPTNRSQRKVRPKT